jgi:hypothetical protein
MAVPMSPDTSMSSTDGSGAEGGSRCQAENEEDNRDFVIEYPIVALRFPSPFIISLA